MKCSVKDFFSKCYQIRRKLRIWSYLLKKSLMKNLIFCAVWLVITNTSERSASHRNKCDGDKKPKINIPNCTIWHNGLNACWALVWFNTFNTMVKYCFITSTIHWLNKSNIKFQKDKYRKHNSKNEGSI